MKRILVAGIGNIFMGDDGFGCEVARQLAGTDLPANVTVVDFGIRGLDLGYALMDSYELAILIDAIDRQQRPGTVFVIEPEFPAGNVEGDGSDEPLIPMHEMDPGKVLRLVAALGSRRPRVLLVACQPETLGGEQGFMGLSETVQSAVSQAVQDVVAIIDGTLDIDAIETVEQFEVSATPTESADQGAEWLQEA